MNNLLTSNGLDLTYLQQLTQTLLKRGANYSDLYLQNSTYQGWSLDEGIIKGGSYSLTNGVGVRAICQAKSFLSYSNIINPKMIGSLVNNLFIESGSPNTASDARLMHVASTDNTAFRPLKQAGVNTIAFAPGTTHAHNLYDDTNPIIASSNAAKTALLQSINELGRALNGVSNVIASLTQEYDEIAIIRSDDKTAFDKRPLIHLSISVIVSQGNKQERGSSGFGGRYLFGDIQPSDLSYHVNIAYQQALLKLEARNAPSGNIPVVLGNRWAGVLLHEAVGHGLESDFNRKKTSAFTDQIGKQVVSRGVTVIDEGSISKRRGSLNIDDEGNATQQTVLIEDGVLCNYLFDELNATLMGAKSTGNGRRESFACAPMPRMTNTYMQNGNYCHDEIIASVKHGIYAETFEGGQVDITSGQFVFNASVAWVIENGKLAYPVKGCALVGNGPQCLKHVTMIGNNMALDYGIGTCGKNGQSVPVGVGQPTIKIEGGLVVGGA